MDGESQGVSSVQYVTYKKREETYREGMWRRNLTDVKGKMDEEKGEMRRARMGQWWVWWWSRTVRPSSFGPVPGEDL